LAAQALCLEEMFGSRVTTGVLWLAKARKTVTVPLGRVEKYKSQQAAEAIRVTRATRQLPAPVDDSRCLECSLNVHCLPSVVADRRRTSNLHSSLFLPPP
jgi:CRISPR-associated exonuclease Cas4